jgi:enoyl-CoA hydratase
LPELIGKARALEMILTGKQVKADEAKQLGLVNSVDENPVEAARSLLHKILKKGPLAVRSAIKAVYHSGHRSGYQVEADLFGQLCETEDFQEGTAAFLEKRQPEFKGR